MSLSKANKVEKSILTDLSLDFGKGKSLTGSNEREMKMDGLYPSACRPKDSSLEGEVEK